MGLAQPAHPTATTSAHAQAMTADIWRQQAELVYNGSFTSAFTNTTYSRLAATLPHVSFQQFLQALALVRQGLSILLVCAA